MCNVSILDIQNLKWASHMQNLIENNAFFFLLSKEVWFNRKIHQERYDIQHPSHTTCLAQLTPPLTGINCLCHVCIKVDLSNRSDHWNLLFLTPSPSIPCLPLHPPRNLSNTAFKVCGFHCPHPYLVLKLAGCGCPSYKDKKSYSSSTAKDWKTIWILFPSSATITQVQFAPFGYP